MKKLHRTGRIREDEGITLAQLDEILANYELKEMERQADQLLKQKKKAEKGPTLKRKQK